MPLPFRRSLPIAGAAVVLMAAPAGAEIPSPAAPHVRAETAEARRLTQEVSEQSPTVRALIERLEHSNVVVYVRFRYFTSLDLDGRVGMLSSAGGRRYLVIELACGRSHLVQMVTLAHELHHSVEIADAPAIVDARTLSEHYSRIGMRTRTGPPSEMFETFAAQDTSAVVRRELLSGTVRTNEEE